MRSRKLHFAGMAVLMTLLQSSLLAQDLIPITGKWNVDASRDYVGVWHNPSRCGYLDGTGDGSINGVTAQIGNEDDVPLMIDFTGDDRDEIALYRPDTRELIFFTDYAVEGSAVYTREVGDDDDIPVIGDWDGDGKDGFALYRQSTHQFWFYQDYDADEPFASTEVGNTDDVPITGNWDGLDGDGYALYRPSTRQVFLFQQYDDTTPFTILEIGNDDDVPVAGDWNASGADGIGLFRYDGGDDYQFWLYDELDGVATQSITQTDPSENFQQEEDGRNVFYASGVPHTDYEGNYITVYDPASSFLPKAIYDPKPEDFNTVYNAGYNLAFLWANYYPLDQDMKNTLDQTNNELRVITYLTFPGGKPFVGKFNGTRDLFGVGPDGTNSYLYFDLDGDDQPDREYKLGDNGDIMFTGDWDGDGVDGLGLYRPSTRTIQYIEDLTDTGGITPAFDVGNIDDLPFSGNWDGLGGDGYALYRPSTREIFYFQESDDTEPFASISVGDTGDEIIAGDWDGDGADGFAVYRPSTRQFWFYQEYNSDTAFLVQEVGDYGDIPVSGDWDNDGADGFGIYRTDEYRSYHEFYTYDNIYDTSDASGEAGHILFSNPMLEQPDYIFGVHVDDEPSNEGENNNNWQDLYDYLEAIYDVYADLSSTVFFHVDTPYSTNSSKVTAWWSAYTTLGEAAVHDDYPVKTSADEVTTISSIAATMQQTRDKTSEALPNWYVSQAFAQNEDFYKPTAQQYKAMVYTAFVHGATGLFAFAYQNDDFSGIYGISPDNYTDLWDASIEINEQLDELTPYILSPTSELEYAIHTSPAPTVEDSPIRCVLKLLDDEYVLIAVNMTNEDFDVVIQFPEVMALADGDVVRLFEEDDVDTKAGAINDAFSAFDTHVYKFNATTTDESSSGSRVAATSADENDTATTYTEFSMTVYPNPSAAGSTFELRGTGNATVQLLLMNSQGQLIKTMQDDPHAGGYHKITWDGAARSGQRMAGMYFYTLYLNGTLTKKGKVLLK